MVDPDGNEFRGRMDYVSINPIDNYTALDGFCDENAVLSTELPRAKWDVSFSDAPEGSVVQTNVVYDSLKDLEQTIQMGMQEGMASTLERLDELLELLNEA